MRTLICLSLLLVPSITRATPIVELVPTSLSLTVGQTASADIVISGLTAGVPPSVGAFDFDVTFSPLLTPTGVDFGLFLGDPLLFEALTDFVLSPGVINLAEVSLLSPGELDALHPDTFRLATLFFQANATGTGALAFSRIVVDDPFGGLLIGSKPVPEPASLTLVGMALLAARAVRKSKRV